MAFLLPRGTIQAEAKAEARLAADHNPGNEAYRKLSSEPGSLVQKEREGKKKQVSEEEIRNLYLKGVDAYAREDYQTAIYFWEQILKADPDHAKAKKGIERARKKMGG